MASYRGGKSRFGKQRQYNAIGFSVSSLNYYGDLSPSANKLSTDISFSRPGFALSYARRLGPRFTLQGQFMFGTIRGSDQESANKGDPSNGIYRYQRNLSFRNQIKELSVIAIFDLYENNSTYMSRVKWTPYIYLGVAGFLHNPQAQAPSTDLQGNTISQAGSWVDLQPLGTEGQNSSLNPSDVNYGNKPYSLAQFTIPFGLGARFRLNEVLDLSFDIGFRFTFTDYLDDVSMNYVDLPKLGSPLAQALSYRTNELPGYPKNPVNSGILDKNGNPVMIEAGYGKEHVDNWRGSSKYNDMYMVTSLKLSYILSPNYHQAKFR